ncbi:MAG TPA: TAT-variant-translocated molybdopterin oxidoreductase, partial [Chthoniobacterales bacterium]
MKENPHYWRSLEELAATPGFETWLHREFPRGASEWTNELHRRDFLRIVGASLALAGLGACTKQPLEKIVPYVEQPEKVVPGKPLYFASAASLGGYGQGIVVTSNEGRPTKIEGNKDHPMSLGATTIWAQADVLDLYDPDRAQVIMDGENASTWGNFLERLNLILAAQAPNNGAGLRFLTQTVTSPTLATQIRAIGKKFPRANWHQWEPLTRDSAQAGGMENLYDFAKAKIIVALDSDFLYLHPAALRHTRDFAAARRVGQPENATMSR